MCALSLSQEAPLEKERTTQLQYSCLKNPTNRGPWWATVHEVATGRTRLTTEQSGPLRVSGPGPLSAPPLRGLQMMGFPCWEWRSPREGTLGPSGLWGAAWVSFSRSPGCGRPGSAHLVWGRRLGARAGQSCGPPAARSRWPPQELKLGGGGCLPLAAVSELRPSSGLLRARHGKPQGHEQTQGFRAALEHPKPVLGAGWA